MESPVQRAGGLGTGTGQRTGIREQPAQAHVRGSITAYQVVDRRARTPGAAAATIALAVWRQRRVKLELLGQIELCRLCRRFHASACIVNSGISRLFLQANAS